MQRLLCCGSQSQCNGQCVANSDSYGLDALKDDVAWSFYFFTLMVWMYAFLAVVWLVSMFIWSVVLWFLVALILICVAVMGICAVCCEGGGGGGEMSCNCCEGGGCEAAACDNCCPCCIHTPGSTMDADVFYWSGTYPYDPWFGYSGYGYVDVPSVSNHSDNGEGGSSSCWRVTCQPIAWMLYVFPAMPENMWGGLLGYYVMGTHMRTPADRLYTGGNSMTEFMRMGWRRSADLHEDLAWRNRVQEFVLGSDENDRVRQQAQNQAGRNNQQRFSQHFGEETRLLAGEFQNSQVMRVGRAHAVCIDRSFCRDDGCFESSFSDYQSGLCWICQGENDSWDLWMSCKHLFCSTCSTQMLQRRMPCPLCRVASTVVLRGNKFDPYAAE